MTMNNSKGQTLVLVAVALVVLLGMAGLALDGGHAYLQRRQMQTAADAGALAGALKLALDENEATIRAAAQQDCVVRNGAESCTVDVYLSDGKVATTAQRTVDTWLAGIIGIPSVTVRAYAEAVVDAPEGLGGLLPAAVGWPKLPNGEPDPDFFVDGGYYELWDKDFRSTYCEDHPTDPMCNADDERGSFGWVDWGSTPPPGCSCSNMNGNGTNELSCVMADPDCSGVRYVGEQIEAIGGVRSPEATLFAELWSGDVILLPVYTNRVEQNGPNRGNFIIAGFAAFEVDEAICEWKGHGNHMAEGPCADDHGQGNQFGKFKKVTGYFRGFVTPETLPGGGPQLGVEFIHLVQ